MLIRCVPSAVVDIGGLIIFAGILRNASTSDHVAYTYSSIFLAYFRTICFVINSLYFHYFVQKVLRTRHHREHNLCVQLS